MAGSGTWWLACGLVALNAALNLIAASCAGWTFNKDMEYAWGDSAFGDNVQGRLIASYFLPLALVASVVGIGSTFAGTYHLRVWRTDSLAAAVSVAFISCLLSILAAGVALKELHVGGRRPANLKVVEGFCVVQPLLEFYYLLALRTAVLLSDKNLGDTPRDAPESERPPDNIEVVVVEGGRERPVRLDLQQI